MTSHNYEILCFFFLQTWMLASSDIYESVMWTTNNPHFQNSNTSELESECFGGTLQMKVHLKSVLPIVCPFEFIIMQTLPSRPSTGVLYENIWIVYDKESFDTCNVNLTLRIGTAQEIQDGKALRNKKLYDCNTPDTLQKYMYSVDFKEKSPVMSGVYFEGGKMYYFLATSDGTPGSLNKTSGGHCNNDGDNKIRMKFQVYVCKTNDSKCKKPDEIGKFTCLRPDKPSPSSSSSISPSTIPSPTPSIDPPQKRNRGVDNELQQNHDRWRIVAVFLLIVCLLLIVVLIYICYKLKKKSDLLCTNLSEVKTVYPQEQTPPYDKVVEKDKDHLIFANQFSLSNNGFEEVDGSLTPKTVDSDSKKSSSPDEGVAMTPVATVVSPSKTQDKGKEQPRVNIINVTQSNGNANAVLMDNKNDGQELVQNGDLNRKLRNNLTPKQQRDKAKQSLPPLKIPNKRDVDSQDIEYHF